MSEKIVITELITNNLYKLLKKKTNKNNTYLNDEVPHWMHYIITYGARVLTRIL